MFSFPTLVRIQGKIVMNFSQLVLHNWEIDSLKPGATCSNITFSNIDTYQLKFQKIFFNLRPAGNFYIDVNFTEIRGEPNTVEMIVRLEASPNSEPSRYLCQGLLGIYLLQLPNCEGLDLSVPYEARKLTTLNKRGMKNQCYSSLTEPQTFQLISNNMKMCQLEC